MLLLHYRLQIAVSGTENWLPLELHPSPGAERSEAADTERELEWAERNHSPPPEHPELCAW